MGNIIWLIIMIPVSLLFTVIGIYALKSKKPMHFWSGSTVRASEITDVPAYNKANGIMWLVFSVIFWISAVLGYFNMPGVPDRGAGTSGRLREDLQKIPEI